MGTSNQFRQMTDVFDGCLFIGFPSLVNERFLLEKEDFSKRSMYGRRSFELLRQRVLQAANGSTGDADEPQKRVNNIFYVVASLSLICP